MQSLTQFNDLTLDSWPNLIPSLNHSHWFLRWTIDIKRCFSFLLMTKLPQRPPLKNQKNGRLPSTFLFLSLSFSPNQSRHHRWTDAGGPSNTGAASFALCPAASFSLFLFKPDSATVLITDKPTADGHNQSAVANHPTGEPASDPTVLHSSFSSGESHFTAAAQQPKQPP